MTYEERVAYQRKYYQEHRDRYKEYQKNYAIEHYREAYNRQAKYLEKCKMENPDYYKDCNRRVEERHPGYFAEYRRRNREKWLKGGIYYKKKRNGNKLHASTTIAPERA